MALKTHPPSKPSRGSFGIYGDSGIGKTTLLGTMPGRGLLIDTIITEGGEQVLADKADRIKVFSCTSWDMVDEIFNSVEAGDENVDWVGFDSVTGMLRLAYRQVIGLDDKEIRISKHKITLPEHGEAGQLVSELIYRFNSITIDQDDGVKRPKFMIWTAQERRHGGGEDDPGPMQIGPDVIRSVLSALKPPMMLLGRVELDTEGNRVLRVGKNDLYMCKARVVPGRKLPDVIAKPNLGKILRYLTSDDPEVVKKNKPRAADDLI